MRNVFIILVSISLILVSCDKEMHYLYIIENMNNKAIDVEFKTYDIPHEVLRIEKGFKDTIYSYTVIEGTKIYERNIVFSQLVIKSDTIISKVNFLLNDSWDYIEESNTQAIYYLKVDSTYFN